jgi:NhaP-type Na+/H+ or K+/H+ antiporter/mannitol/fructose-specific phosphotransferase system IIA component (Ntr-type)
MVLEFGCQWLLAAGGHSDSAAITQTLFVAIAAGTMLILLSERVGVPAVAPLLVGGFFLGPEVLNWVQPESLGPALRSLVAIAVAIILFEGGLHLSISGYRTGSVAIRRLLTVGVVVTWIGTAIALRLMTPLTVKQSLLAASLVIVTGPTVIGPLLHRIRVRENLHHILHWEGVLIDPVGVFIALLCFEWYTFDASSSHAAMPLLVFAWRIFVGIGIGALAGAGISFLIRRKWIPGDQLNLFVFGAVMVVFGVCEFIVEESGILAVVASGYGISLWARSNLDSLRKFESQITHLCVGILFILLTATLKVSEMDGFGMRGVLVICVVLLVVRPLNIFLSTINAGLTLREKLFLSWIAPRGVVAASMAALFAVILEEQDEAEFASYLRTFTYGVICISIFAQGLSAGLAVKLLGLQRPEPTKYVIIGSHRLARSLVLASGSDLKYIMIDTNADAVRAAKHDGFHAICGDALNPESVIPEEEMASIGYVLALTDNQELNAFICSRWMQSSRHIKAFRWANQAGPFEDTRNGTPVWTNLPKPTVLSRELDAGETKMVRDTVGADTEGGVDIVQMVAIGDDGWKIRADEAGPGTPTISVHRMVAGLHQLINPEMVVSITPGSQVEVFRQMVEHVAKLHPDITVDSTVDELETREETYSTAIGNGIAVPHAYCDALSSSICAMGQVPDGVSAWRTPDGKPVRLVFLLMSSPKRPGAHLALLARIAGIAASDELVESLVQAPSPQQVVSIVRAHEYEGTASTHRVSDD